MHVVAAIAKCDRQMRDKATPMWHFALVSPQKLGVIFLQHTSQYSSILPPNNFGCPTIWLRPIRLFFGLGGREGGRLEYKELFTLSINLINANLSNWYFVFPTIDYWWTQACLTLWQSRSLLDIRLSSIKLTHCKLTQLFRFVFENLFLENSSGIL